MTVALLTMFGRLDCTYSLVNVVAEQLRMLLGAGLRVRLLVSEQFARDSRFGIYLDERIEWGYVCNTLRGRQIQWRDYDQTEGAVHETFFDEADAVAESLTALLADADVCILHDILYQGWYLLHNVALRLALRRLPRLRCVSFAHSAPLARPARLVWPFSARFLPLPRTAFAALTQAALPPTARQYGVAQPVCRVVHNSLDALAFLHPAVRALARKTDLFSPEVLLVYPARLTPAKGFEKAAALAGALRRAGAGGVRAVFCDFPAADTAPAPYRAAVRAAGARFGAQPGDVVFTSELGFAGGFPRAAVLDLCTLSNLFVMPSFSEAFPLTALEAASRGNLLVLNEAVPALAEVGRLLGGVFFMRWDALNDGYATVEEYEPSEEAYYAACAAEVCARLRGETALRAKTAVRRRFCPQWVWKNQLAPLVFGQKAAETEETRHAAPGEPLHDCKR